MARKNMLAMAVVLLAGSSGAASRSVTESINTWHAANDIGRAVIPPMPPEVARKEDRRSWKRAQKYGRR